MHLCIKMLQCSSTKAVMIHRQGSSTARLLPCTIPSWRWVWTSSRSRSSGVSWKSWGGSFAVTSVLVKNEDPETEQLIGGAKGIKAKWVFPCHLHPSPAMWPRGSRRKEQTSAAIWGPAPWALAGLHPKTRRMTASPGQLFVVGLLLESVV